MWSKFTEGVQPYFISSGGGPFLSKNSWGGVIFTVIVLCIVYEKGSAHPDSAHPDSAHPGMLLQRYENEARTIVVFVFL